MKSERNIASYLVFVVAVVLFAACSSQRQPAHQALDEIASVVEAMPPDADQYVPEQFASVKNNLADLNASFDKRDYSAVLAGAPAVLSAAKGVAAAAAAKKDAAMGALAAAWTQLSNSVPALVASVKARVDALSKSHRLPKDIDLAASKTELADATVLWQKAQMAYDWKHLEEAVTAAKDAKSNAEAAASALKMG